MRTLRRGVPAGAALAALAWLAVGAGGAGGTKDSPWKPILPPEACPELVTRASNAIREGISNNKEDTLKRAQVEAVRIVAYTLSTKGGTAANENTRQAALKLAEMIRDKKDLSRAKVPSFTPDLKPGKGVAKELPDIPKHLGDLADLMNLYRHKAKGGEGIAEVLQTSGPLKNQNGIEEKLRYLVRKKLPANVLEKESNELALLGYKIAVDGELTGTFASSKKGDAREWLKYSEEQRDTATQLAEAAKKKDAAAVQTAAEALDKSCTQCHKKFRTGG
jgi:hypothetical protein